MQFWSEPMVPAPKRPNAELKALGTLADLDPRPLATLEDLRLAMEAIGFSEVELNQAEQGNTILDWNAPSAGALSLYANGHPQISEPERVALLLAEARSEQRDMALDMNRDQWDEDRQNDLRVVVERTFKGPMTPEALAATKESAVKGLLTAIQAIQGL